MSESASGLPARPSLEQLRKRAKELLRDARAGDADSMARLRRSGITRELVNGQMFPLTLRGLEDGMAFLSK